MGDEQLIENVRLAIVVDEVLSKKEEVEIDETVLSETFFTPVKKSTKLSEPDFNDLNALNKKLTDGLDKEIEVECEEDKLYVNIDYDKGNYSNFLEKAKEVLLLLGEHGVCVAQVVSHTMKLFYCKYKLSEKFSDYNLCLKCTIPKDERNSDYQHFYANIYFGKFTFYINYFLRDKHIFICSNLHLHWNFCYQTSDKDINENKLNKQTKVTKFRFT